MMKKANVTRVIAVTLLVLLLAMVLATACAKLAPAPAPSPAPAPKPAPAAKTNPLTAIIEGAKKEGAVTISMTAGYDEPERVNLLEKAIKAKYGVDLKITAQATAGMAALIAKTTMELQTGTAPTYDAIMIGTDNVPDGTKAGIFEMVDWRNLLEPGAPRELQYDHPQLKAGIVTDAGSTGLMYNPQKISAAEVPKKFSDMADPKWKGRLGIHDYVAYWARYAFVLGKDKMMANFRSIITTNKPIMDRFPPLNTRYMAGEIDVAFSSIQYIRDNQAKGKQTAWQNLELLEIRDFQMLVIKGAKNANAAKLLSLFLTSTEGAKFTVDVVKKSHHLYPGNQLYDAVNIAKKEGTTVVTWEYPGLLDFMLSPAYEQWQKEFQIIRDTTK